MHTHMRIHKYVRVGADLPPTPPSRIGLSKMAPEKGSLEAYFVVQVGFTHHSICACLFPEWQTMELLKITEQKEAKEKVH